MGRAQVTAIYSDLEGKVVLVTGGGSGIGEAIVRKFVEQNCRVAFIDIAGEPSQVLVKELASRGLSASFVHADLRDVQALRSAIARVQEELGPIEILINNAAY